MHKRLSQFIWLSLFIGLSTTSVFGQSASELFSPTSSDPSFTIPADPTYAAISYVNLNGAVADAIAHSDPSDFAALDTISVSLFAQTPYELDQVRRGRVSDTGTALTGSLKGHKGSSFALVIHDSGIISGSFTVDNQLYRVLPAGDSVHAVIEIDSSQYPPDAEPLEDGGPVNEYEPVEGDDTASNVLDVLVVYTPAAKTAEGGTAAIEALIDLAITESNTGLTDSAIGLQYNLVHKEEISYSEVDFGTDLTRLKNIADGHMDSVHELRNIHKADVVAMIRDSGGSCGIAYRMVNESASFAPLAFSVTSRTCATGYYSFAHEIGHNMGAHHDRFVATGTPVFNYAYGYVDPGDSWRTILAYGADCGNCTRINRWSNAELTYSGTATGVVSTDPLAADNQLTIDMTKDTAVNWRISNVTMPAELTAPVDETILSASETFTYAANEDIVGEWQLILKQSESITISDSGVLPGTTTSYTFNGIPQDGNDLYVEFYHRVASNEPWQNAYDNKDFGTFYSTSPDFCPMGVTKNSFMTYDWESGTTSGWTQTDFASTNTWEASGANPDNGSYHLHADDSNENADTALAMESSLYIAPGSFLNVRHHSQLEHFHDGGIVEYSTDDGATWLNADTMFTHAPDYTQHLQFDGMAFSRVDVGGGYRTLRADLSPLAGQSVKFRFRVQTDFSDGYGGWDIDDIEVYTCGTGVPAIETPAEMSVLAGSSDTFSWDTNGYNNGEITQWVTYAGSTPGGFDYSIISHGTSTSGDIDGLPTGGQDVYVTLYYKVNGVWNSSPSQQYTAATSGGPVPSIQSPLPDQSPPTVLAASADFFTWSANAYTDSITQYALYAGSTPGGFDYFVGGFGTATEGWIQGLPTGGHDVYVTLWWKSGGNWYNDGSDLYEATTASPAYPTIIYPQELTELYTIPEYFQWSPNGYPGTITQWATYVGSAPGAYDYGINSHGTSRTADIGGWPCSGQGNSVWLTLWYKDSVSGWANSGSTEYVVLCVGTDAAQ